MLQKRTYNTFIFEITPGLQVLQLQPESFSTKSAMKTFTLKSNCVLMEPRVKKRKDRKSNPQQEYDILEFNMWVGHDIKPEQVYKAVELAQFHNVPISDYRVESISKHLRKVSELVDMHNSMLQKMRNTTS